jgi:hypothetical protein
MPAKSTVLDSLDAMNRDTVRAFLDRVEGVLGRLRSVVDQLSVFESAGLSAELFVMHERLDAVAGQFERQLQLAARSPTGKATPASS